MFTVIPEWLPRGTVRRPGVLSERMVEARPGEPPSRLLLRGQEALLFRRISTTEEVQALTRRFGLLGLDLASVAPLDEDPPTWKSLLTTHSSAQAEGVEDWVRQSALLGVAVGAIAVAQSPDAQNWLKGMAGGRLRPPWQVEELLQAAERLGVTGVSFQEGARPPYSAYSLRSPYGLEFPLGDLSADDLYRLVADLVEPWLRRARLYPQAEAEGLRIGVHPVPEIVPLVEALWLQVAYAATASFPLRKCAWENCKGPPTRPGVFMWRFERSVENIRHRDSNYCTSQCESAATSKAYRDQKGGRLCQSCGKGPLSMYNKGTQCGECEAKRRGT